MKLIDTATVAGLMVIIGFNPAFAGQYDGSNGRGPTEKFTITGGSHENDYE